MKPYMHYLFLLIVTLAIVSCENELSFSTKDNPPKLVMNALINADSVTNVVYLNLTGKEQVTHILNATLTVHVNGKLTESLRPLPIPPNAVPQCSFTMKGKFTPEDVVRLDAFTDDGQYHAWAEVTIPRRPDNIEEIDTLTVPLTQSGYTRNHLRHKITIKDLTGEDNYYRLVMDTRVIQTKLNGNKEIIATQTWHNYNFVSREDVVLTDGQPTTGSDEENSMFDTTKNTYGVFNDSRFKNSIYTMTVYVPSELFRGIDPLGPFLSEQADITVRLLSITETEYYYLRALNLASSDAYDEMLSEPIKYPSNVHGGTGIVGASTETSKIIHIKKMQQ